MTNETPPPTEPTPSKDELEAKAKHFATSAFLIGSGILMVAANSLQPLAAKLMGEEFGSQAIFIFATILIFVLASKRPELAAFAIKRQCQKYGHVVRNGAPVCDRCKVPVAELEQQG